MTENKETVKANKKGKRSEKRQKQKSKKKKILKRICIGIGAITGLGVLGAGATGLYLYNKYSDEINYCIVDGYKKVDSINANTFNNKHTTEILDKNGKVLKEFKLTNYKYEKYKDINPNIFKAFVSIEDERFYEHHGVDYYGILRAGVHTLKGEGLQGGSTLTQQLVKNTLLTSKQTVWRKLEEVVIAQEIEKKYSKQDILEFYVNNIYLGHGCYGVESASQYYFGKDTSKLSLSQVATIAGITNNPTLYDPINKPDNALKRRNVILYKMFELGYISESDKNKAINEPLNLDIHKTTFANEPNNYAVDYAIQKSTENLMKYEGFKFQYKFKTDKERENYLDVYNSEFAKTRDELLSGGYKIETSIDMDVQNELQKIVDNKLSDYRAINKNNGLYMKQASATLVDNKTGEVVAIVGGRSQKGNTYNRASLAPRQPGSVIKPLVSYTPAFENGYLPDDKMEDAYIKNGPVNWYHSYKGYVTLRYATEISLNTIPYRLTQKYGTQNCLDYLRNMNFKYITPQDTNPIISIGGFTRGTTTVEMASGFETLANNGKFIAPTNVTQITKIGLDNVIYKNKQEKKKVYDAGASYLMTDVLMGVINKSHGTAYRCRMSGWNNQTGKTGTTDASKDAWFCGYTPYYSMAVWVGDDIPAPQDMAGGTVPGSIWHDMMTYMHQGKEDIPFEKPSSIYYDDGVIKVKRSEGNKVEKERKLLNEKRKEAEITYQKNRLEKEAYRIKFGLSDEEENVRETKAKLSLETLKKFEFKDLSQLGSLNELMKTTKNFIDDVKREDVNSQLMDEYKSTVSKFESKRLYFIQLKQEEEAKKEQEIAKKREAEIQRQNQERQAQIQSQTQSQAQAQEPSVNIENDLNTNKVDNNIQINNNIQDNTNQNN